MAKDIFYGEDSTEGIAKHLLPCFAFDKTKCKEERIAEYQCI